MKLLLFDQNLSPHLVERLADIYPGSVHVSMIGLGAASDRAIWEYARQHDYMITTKDADFGELGLLWGFPPKIVWIRRGNCSTSDIEYLLRNNYEAVVALSEDQTTGVLALF
jgi:predicted nuclease of predicted toxin-antitoxin system